MATTSWTDRCARSRHSPRRCTWGQSASSCSPSASSTDRCRPCRPPPRAPRHPSIGQTAGHALSSRVSRQSGRGRRAPASGQPPAGPDAAGRGRAERRRRTRRCARALALRAIWARWHCAMPIGCRAACVTSCAGTATPRAPAPTCCRTCCSTANSARALLKLGLRRRDGPARRARGVPASAVRRAPGCMSGTESLTSH